VIEDAKDTDDFCARGPQGNERGCRRLRVGAEGLVFHELDGKLAKIKRRDFDYED